MKTNQEIAEVLREMAVWYEMDDVAFKPAVYERAADSVELYDESISELFRREGPKGLRKISGVGEAIAKHIEGLLKRGTFPEYERYHKKYPIHALELTSVSGLGPKTLKTLYLKLRITNLDDLERAAKSGKLRSLPRLGEKIEKKILSAIERLRHDRGRRLLGDVLPISQKMESELKKIPGVKHAVTAGSVRRRQETIGDIDILVTTSKPKAVMAAFVKFPEIAEVLEQGPTKTTVRLRNGILSDVRVIPDKSFGAALQYFTGDKNHNIIVRGLAVKKGLKLNEYGIWRGQKHLASRTEEEVYKVLKFPYIEPELRTASGEIEAAQKGKLPKLIGYGSLRGDLQVQSNWTDGAASISEMARAAQEFGLEYIAITDHSRALAMTGGLDPKKLKKQAREIDLINHKNKKAGKQFTILKGTECDILKNGSLDLPDSALAKLDIVGASIHSHFKLSSEEQTKRLIAAMENSHVDIIFHPTGRRIGRREPYDLDFDAILAVARATGTALEIDAYPDRSDLRDVLVRKAVAAGVKLVINTDAHHPMHLRYLDLGVAIARRGWASSSDILNTRPLAKLLEWFRTSKNKRG